MQRTYQFGAIEVDAVQRTVRVDHQPASLGGRAFDLLLVLLENAGSLVTKDRLLDAVWGKTIVEEANLHVHVSALRKVLGVGAIGTVPGRGYRLTLPRMEPAGTGAATSPTPSAAGVRPLPLLGRQHDSVALHALLADHRVVTITGAGGIGKTRLAAAALWDRRTHFADGVATVELAAIADPLLLVGAVAGALKLPVSASDDALPALLAAVRPLEALILLDNAEHLVDAVAALAAALVDGAPKLRVLVTSQVPLRLAQERVFRLRGLDVPEGQPVAGVADALTYGAVALFDDRLRAADRRACVDDDNLAAVLDICRRLDGIALAIELAAARCPLLGVRGVAERLDERFRLLRSDSRATPSRQQTLGAAMAWSHSLLTGEQQAAFRQLGVFTGSFTLEMAIHVIRVPGLDEVGAIDVLAELVDRSLVSVDTAETPRYRLLETGRLFALAKLAESGESAATRRRHATALRDHFRLAWDASWTMPEVAYVERYEADLDNLRAAFDDALQHDAGAAIAMAADSARLSRCLSLHPEALRRCQAASMLVDASTPAALEARLRESMAQVSGDLSHVGGRAAAQRAAELYAEVGDARGRYLSLAHLAFSYSGSLGSGPEPNDALAEMKRIEDPRWPAAVRLFGRKIEANLALAAGDLETASAATRSRLELATACGSQRDANAALGNLADLALIAGDPEQASRLNRAMLARLGRHEASTRIVILGNLLHSLLEQGSDVEARETAVETIARTRALGFMFLMYVCDALALLAVRERRWPAAVMLLGYSDAAYAAQGQAREQNEARAHRLARDAIQAHCSAGEVTTWLREGAGLAAEDVAGIALEAVA